MNTLRQIRTSMKTNPNRKIITNDMDADRFQTSMIDYRSKQQGLVEHLNKLVTRHQKCRQFAEKTPASKDVFIEDVEHAVARIVDQAFGRRRADRDESASDGAQEELRATREQLARDKSALDAAQEELRATREQLARDKSARDKSALDAAQKLRATREQLARANDRLRASDKQRRDLLNALHRDRLDSETDVALLRAKLKREKESNAILQSMVDEMYYATVVTRGPRSAVAGGPRSVAAGVTPPPYTRRYDGR